MIEIQKILSYSFFSYLIAFALITLFFIKKINFDKKFRFIIYLLIPYIINMIVWYFNGYQVINYKYTSVMVTDFLFISYVIHFIFIITIIAYILDYTFRFKIKK